MDTDYCWLDEVIGVDFDALGAVLSSSLAGANFHHVADTTTSTEFLTAA